MYKDHRESLNVIHFTPFTSNKNIMETLGGLKNDEQIYFRRK